MNTAMQRRRRLLRVMIALPAAAVVRPPEAGATTRAAPRLIVTNSFVAEIVVALGSASQIVAVGGGVDHLSELAGVPRLPGFRQSSAEPMLAMRPDRVVVGNEFTVPQVLEQLRGAGVAVDLVDAEATPAGVERRIRQVALILGKVPEGEALVRRFQRELADALQKVGHPSPRPRALFILAGGGRPTLVGGRGTNVATLLEMAGATNAAGAIEGFKAMSQEAMVEAAPDVILTNREGTTASDGVAVALRAPGALATPAGRSGRLITIPSEYLQGMGIHTPAGIALLARQLHGSSR